MELKPTQIQIDFFKQKMNVDVSNVVIEDVSMEKGKLGSFVPKTKVISIDTQKIKEIYKGSYKIIINTTITHELTHYCQFICNKSLILPINNVFTAKLLFYRFEGCTWENDPFEIDALLVECYYLYILNGATNSIMSYIKIACERIDFNTLVEYAIRLNDKSFLECLNKSLKSSIKMNGGN